MPPDQLLSISEAAGEAGVNRSTLQRWIAAGRLQKEEEGKVRLREVLRCRKAQRTGRRPGFPASEWKCLLSETQKANAKPFLHGELGFRRFKAMLPGVIAYHVRAGRKAKLYEALTAAASSVLEVAKPLPPRRAYERELSQAVRELKTRMREDAEKCKERGEPVIDKEVAGFFAKNRRR